MDDAILTSRESLSFKLSFIKPTLDTRAGSASKYKKCNMHRRHRKVYDLNVPSNEYIMFYVIFREIIEEGTG